MLLKDLNDLKLSLTNKRGFPRQAINLCIPKIRVFAETSCVISKCKVESLRR